MKKIFWGLKIWLVLGYLAIIPIAILLTPFSYGWSLMMIVKMAWPWNWAVAAIPYLGIIDSNTITVLAGIILNSILIYLFGRMLEEANNNKNLPR